MLRRSRVQAILLCACAVGATIFILSQLLGGSDPIPSGAPPVVIVTVLDEDNYSKEYIDNVRENRMEYAKKHGEIIADEYKRYRLTCYRLHDLLPSC
jgi:mannan polymerase II complex MNN11 subunit